MKNKLILLMGFFALMLIGVIAFFFMNLKAVTLVLPQSGSVVSNGKVIVAPEGTSVVQNTPVNLLVNNETTSNNAFFISEDSSVIIPLKDVFYVNEEAEIGLIQKNTVITFSGNEYKIGEDKKTYKELVLYNPEDQVLGILSPTIKYADKNYEKSLIIEMVEGGAMKVHDNTKGSTSEVANYLVDNRNIVMQGGEFSVLTYQYKNKDNKVVDIKKTTKKDVTNQPTSKSEEKSASTSEKDKEKDNSTGTPDKKDGNGNGDKASAKSAGGAPDGVASPTKGLSKALEAFFSQINETIPKIYSANRAGWDFAEFDVTLSDPDSTLLGADLIVTEEGAKSPTSVTSLKFTDNEAHIKVSNLKPETKYNYRIEMTYYPKGEETRAIVESSYFKTNDYVLASEFIEIKDKSTKLLIHSNEHIKYKSGKVIIDDRKGNKVEQDIDFEESIKPEGQLLEFTGLKSNTTYYVYYKELLIGEKYITIPNEEVIKTRKITPNVQPPLITIDYINSSFNAVIPALDDPDFLVESAEYVIYNATDSVNPVKVYNSKYHPTNNNYAFKVDSSILRNRNYRFQVVFKGFDNISKQEIKSELTNSFSIIGSQPPEAELTIAKSTSNSISGSVTIKDPDHAMISNAKVVLKQGNKVISTQEITTLNAMVPIQFTGLSPLTSYTVEVQASFDLANGQPTFTNYPIIIRVVGTSLF